MPRIDPPLDATSLALLRAVSGIELAPGVMAFNLEDIERLKRILGHEDLEGFVDAIYERGVADGKIKKGAEGS